MQAVSVKYAEYCALTASRLGAPPLQHPPASPLAPGQRLRVGYVSSDFGNHPLSHLMASVFGLHDRSRLEVMKILLHNSIVLQFDMCVSYMTKPCFVIEKAVVMLMRRSAPGPLTLQQ